MSNSGYPLWVAMGAAVFGTLLGGGAVYMGLTGAADAYVGGFGVLPAQRDVSAPEGEAADGGRGAEDARTLGDGDEGSVSGDGPEVGGPRGPTSLADAVAATRSTVVTLKVGDRLNGAGVVFDPDGYVFTNFHVVEPLMRGQAFSTGERPATATARFVNGRELPARVVAADSSEDIAILQLVPADSAERFDAAPIGESSGLRVGETVFAVGSPVGLEHTVSAGIVSALDRTDILANRQLGLIQLDASVNVGNSGGPLFNLEGQLVGITAARSSRAEGIGFAIPIDRIRVFLDTLRSGSGRRSGVVGIEMDPNHPVGRPLTGSDYATGVYVNRVEAEGPAQRAGLEVGDVIVAVKGRRFDEAGTDALGRREIARRIVSRVRALLPGETLALTVVRGDETVDVNVEVEAANDSRQVTIDAERVLGLRVAAAAQDQDDAGVVVQGLVPEAPIARIDGAERLVGMKLVQIAGISIKNADDLGAVLPDLEAISRSGRRRQMALTFESSRGEQLQVPGYPLASANWR